MVLFILSLLFFSIVLCTITRLPHELTCLLEVKYLKKFPLHIILVMHWWKNVSSSFSSVMKVGVVFIAFLEWLIMNIKSLQIWKQHEKTRERHTSYYSCFILYKFLKLRGILLKWSLEVSLNVSRSHSYLVFISSLECSNKISSFEFIYYPITGFIVIGWWIFLFNICIFNKKILHLQLYLLETPSARSLRSIENLKWLTK